MKAYKGLQALGSTVYTVDRALRAEGLEVVVRFKKAYNKMHWVHRAFRVYIVDVQGLYVGVKV